MQLTGGRAGVRAWGALVPAEQVGLLLWECLQVPGSWSVGHEVTWAASHQQCRDLSIHQTMLLATLSQCCPRQLVSQ